MDKASICIIGEVIIFSIILAGIVFFGVFGDLDFSQEDSTEVDNSDSGSFIPIRPYPLYIFNLIDSHMDYNPPDSYKEIDHSYIYDAIYVKVINKTTLAPIEGVWVNTTIYDHDAYHEYGLESPEETRILTDSNGVAIVLAYKMRDMPCYIKVKDDSRGIDAITKYDSEINEYTFPLEYY